MGETWDRRGRHGADVEQTRGRCGTDVRQTRGRPGRRAGWTRDRQIYLGRRGGRRRVGRGAWGISHNGKVPLLIVHKNQWVWSSISPQCLCSGPRYNRETRMFPLSYGFCPEHLGLSFGGARRPCVPRNEELPHHLRRNKCRKHECSVTPTGPL